MKFSRTIILLIAVFLNFTSFSQQESNAYALANKAYENENYEKAATLFVDAYNMLADEQTKMYAAYNAACAFALSKNKKQGLKYAKIALENGMLRFEGDKDFEYIKNSGKFKKIVKAADKKIAELQSPASSLPITYTPKSYNKNELHPLIVILHGYGGNPANIIELYKPLADARGAILLSCRASEVMTENSFYWDFDNTEALTLLRRQVENTIKKFSIDQQKVILTGFSQGGFLSYDFGFKNADLFTAFLPVAGRVPQVLELHQQANKNLKVYSIAGLKEPKNFLIGYEDLDEKLDKLNIAYQLKFYNIGHQYPENNEEELLKAFDWLVE